MISKLNPMRFSEPTVENSYYDKQLQDGLLHIQIACFIAGVLYYLFFIWDSNAAPENYLTAQILRGLVGTPIIWLATASSFLPPLRRFLEPISCATCVIATVLDIFISIILEKTTDFSVVPILIIFIFTISFLRWRLEYYLLFFLTAYVAFIFASILAGGHAMLVPNNLAILSSIIICLFASVTRERESRRNFIAEQELIKARAQVEDLLRNIALPAEIERLKTHSARNTKPNITISYRRADTDAITGRIRDRLILHFGIKSIYMDIDNIPFGFDFRRHIQNALSETDLLLVVIGPNWLGVHAGDTARLDDESDPVRLEVETALRQKKLILPVLVSGTLMPIAAALPSSLKEIAFLNAAEVNTGRDFSVHMERLIRSIDKLLEQARVDGINVD